jgi:hypothetical protein
MVLLSYKNEIRFVGRNDYRKATIIPTRVYDDIRFVKICMLMLAHLFLLSVQKINSFKRYSDESIKPRKRKFIPKICSNPTIITFICLSIFEDILGAKKLFQDFFFNC